MNDRIRSTFSQCAAAAVLLLCVLLLGCHRAPDNSGPAETAMPTEQTATEAPSIAPTDEPEATEPPEQTDTPAPTEEEQGIFSRYGRSPRIPEYLGDKLYRDYRTLMDSLYECRETAELTRCASSEEFLRIADCVKLMFIPRDLLRDPSFLTVTPFEFDPETRTVKIRYCWEDRTLSEEELPCANRDDYLAQIDEFIGIVEGILNECVCGFDAAEEDALALFTWTADNLYYEINRNDSAYTALHDHRAYCSIYAEVYQFLAEEAGIECMRVSGATQAGWGDHEWDLVRLNGNWYHVDATAQGSDHYAQGYYFGMSDAVCVKLGYGSIDAFALSDELGRGCERPECTDQTYDNMYRSWMIGG